MFARILNRLLVKENVPFLFALRFTCGGILTCNNFIVKNKHMRLSTLLLLAALFVLSAPVHAQNTPNTAFISGVVTDGSTKLPVYDVVVTLSTPAFNGKRFAVTDSSGIYKFLNLTPGLYTLVFEMEGYDKVTKENMQLEAGKPLGVSIELVKTRSFTLQQQTSKTASAKAKYW